MAYFIYKEGNRFWRTIVFRPGASDDVREETMPIVVSLKRTFVW